MKLDEIDAKFQEFDAANPDIYSLFEKFTIEVINSGYKHFSADAICHRIRWYTNIEKKRYEFKLNNNFTSRYARKFEADYPQHKGFFNLRALHAW